MTTPTTIAPAPKRTRTSKASRAAAQIAAAPPKIDTTAANAATALIAGVSKPATPAKPKPVAKPKPAAKPAPAPAAEKVAYQPKGATTDLLLNAVYNALPKTAENAPMRKLLAAAIKRSTDVSYVSGSSPSQRSKHNSVKLVSELEALSAK